MPTFTYAARDAAGKPHQGEIEAGSAAEAARTLRDEGKYVVSLAAAGPSRRGRIIPPAPPIGPRGSPAAAPAAGLLAPRLDPDDVRGFAQQMAVMLETGVSLHDALETCMDDRQSPAFRAALEDVHAQVEAGSSFSAALARHPRVFSPLFVNMVKASEASGQVGTMLRRVADFLAGQRDLARKIKAAVAYPLVMLVLSLGVTSFLIVFVLPRFARIYAGKEHVLPAITRVLMGSSGWLTAYGPWLGSAAAALVVAAVVQVRRPAGRQMWDRAKLRLPLFSGLLHTTYLARSMRTLGTLIQAGVSMLEAVELTRNAVGNDAYARLWAQCHERLQHGQQLSETLADSPFVPRAVYRMIQAGERGGKVAPVMDRIARHCEEEVAARIKAVTALIEPAIVTFLGAVVGTVVIALLLPIFTISRAMKPGL